MHCLYCLELILESSERHKMIEKHRQFSSAIQENTWHQRQVLLDPKWPAELPFNPAEDFERFDDSDDALFYDQPRFVTHIDDAAIAALTAYYRKHFPASGQRDTALLDMCSSWISHFPEGYTAGRISGASCSRIFQA